MPTTVFVNDYNIEVTFPDGVSQSEMQSALAKQFPAKGKAAPAPTEKPGLLKRAIDKVTDIVGGASMGESEQFKQMAEGGLQGISDFSNFLDSPQEPAKDTKDFLTRTVPVSALRLVKGTVQMPGQIVKGIAQTASDLERSASYADVKGAINPALLDVIQNKPRDPGLGDLGKGMIDFIAGATGLYNQETGKWATGYEEWGYNYINNLMNDPVGTMAVLYPAGVKGGKVFNKVQFTKTVAKEMAKSGLDKQTASLKVLVNKYPTYIKNVKPGAVPYEKLTHLENVLERQDARLVAEEQARLDAIKQSAKEIRAGDVKPQSPAPVTETILTPKEAASIATKEAIEIVPNELGRVVEGFFKNPDVLIENKTKNARRTSSEILRGFEEKGKGEIVKEPTKAEILEEHKQIVEAEKAKEAPAPESKPSNGNGKPAWQMTRKEYMKENPYSSAASHQFKIREAILAGENVPKNILKEYPELAKVAYEVNYGKIDRGSFSWKKKGEIEPDFSHITDPELREQVEAVERMYQNTDNAIAARAKKSWEDVKNWVTEHVIDRRGNAKRALLRDAGELGREAAMNSDLISGSSGKAGVMTEAAHKKIFADLTIGEHGVLKRIIQSKRTIEIDSYKQGMKHSEGLTGLDHQAYLDNLKDAFKLTDEQMQKLNQKADAYFDEMKTQLEELRANGMITQEAYDALKNKNYSPREFLDKIDPAFEMTIGGKRINVTESGVKALKEGDYGLMENNPEKLLSQVIARTQSRIFRNEANKSLHTIALSDEAMRAIAEGKAVDFADFAQKYGVNAEQAGKLRSVNTNGLVQVRPFKDSVQLSTFIDGQKHTFHVYKDLAKDWVVNDPLVNSQFANILQWISGAKVVKAVATGYNPAFVITNMPRDIGLIWSSTKEYSSHLPVAFGEMVSDLVKVAPDVIKRTGRVKNFVNEGGQMTFLTHYGKFRGQGHLIEKVNSLGNLLAWAGETSELWTRIALRERAIKNGASPVEATHVARNYLDFSQGGNMVKAIDNVVPYFNASVQGTRSLLRGAAKDPKVFTYKMAQLGTLATGLYLANQINKECWDSISDRDKEANFIITTPWKYTDDQGQERHLYFKIAKDQGQRAFTSLFEGIMQIAVEKKVPTEQMMMAIGDLFPVPGLPPTVKALVAYLTNRDMWNFEEIWKGQEGIDPKEEYHDKTTNPAFITAGKVTGMSPARMENAVGNITPYNNPFVNLVGGGVKTLFGSLPEEVQSKSVIQMMTENGSIRRFLSATNPYTQHREDMEEGTMKGKTENFKNNREFDRLYNEYIKAGRDPKIGDKIDNWLNTLPEYEADRLSNRADMIDAVDKLPDRTWWKKLAQVQQPEARAEIFYKRWVKASPEERQRLEENLEKIPGIASERFYDKSDELVAKGGR